MRATLTAMFRLLHVLLLLALLAGPLAAEPTRIVFLVHGWNGSAESFGVVPKMLASAQSGLWPEGHFTVVPIEYRSPRPDATLPEQAAAAGKKIVEQTLALKVSGPREVHFVTHSMGALIVRQLWLDHNGKAGVLGDLFRDLKTAV